MALCSPVALTCFQRDVHGVFECSFLNSVSFLEDVPGSSVRNKIEDDMTKEKLKHHFSQFRDPDVKIRLVFLVVRAVRVILLQ